MKKLVMFCMMAVCCGCFATEIEVNGSFKGAKPGNALPPGWKAPTQPGNSFEVVEADGKPALKMISKGATFSIYTDKNTPSKSGEVYLITANVSGKGSATIGLIIFEQKGLFIRNLYAKPVSVDGTSELKAEFVVPETDDKGRTPGNIRFAMCTPGKAEITFHNIKVEKGE